MMSDFLPEMALLGAGNGNLFQTLMSPQLMPLLVIGILFYLMLIRPERRKVAAKDQMRNALKKNDRVVTRGGIMGTVVNVSAESREVTLRVDENTNARIRVVREAVEYVLTDTKEDSGSSK